MMKIIKKGKEILTCFKTLSDDKVRDKDKIIDYKSEEEKLESRNTLADYLSVLDRINLFENQNTYSNNYRSRDRKAKFMCIITANFGAVHKDEE